MSIAKQKYEKSKRRISDLQRLLDRSEIDNTEKTLELLNKEQEFTELQNTNTQLQAEVSRWKSLSERLPDDAEIEELHRTNKKQSKLIDNLEKQIAKLENNREILLFQIKTLEESRNDLKTQLLELKQEYRESKKG
jgi:chromosome segregation ATPase